MPCIAVVDDQQSVRKALERLLRSAGFVVRCFESGASFLEALEDYEPSCVVLDLHMAEQLERYLIEVVLASRDARRYDPQLARRIAWGASPRGSIALERCARARAWLAGRDYVTPEDVRAIAPDVLRHRVLPSYEATAEGWDGDRLVAALLDVVPLP